MRIELWENGNELYIEETWLKELEYKGPIGEKGDEFFFRDDMIQVRTKDFKYGMVNFKGQYILKPEWDNICKEEEGFSVKKNELWGWADLNGKILLPPKYKHKLEFHEGLCKVSVDGKIGFINTKGKMVIQPNYDRAERFREGFAPFERKGFLGIPKRGFVDHSGKEVLSTQCYCEDGFHEGYFMDDGRFFGREKNVLECFRYNQKNKKETVYGIDRIKPFCNGYAGICIEDKWGYINKEGKVVVEPKWTAVGDFNKMGYAFVKSQMTYSIIDSSGYQIAIDCRDAMFCENGFLIQDYYSDKWGYMDYLGNEKIPRQWDACVMGTEGAINVYRDGKAGVVNTSGKLILPLEWDCIWAFSSGIALVRKEGVYYPINVKGETAFAEEQVKVEGYNVNGIFIMEKDEKFYICDCRRKSVGGKNWPLLGEEIVDGLEDEEWQIGWEIVETDDINRYIKFAEKKYGLAYAGAKILYQTEDRQELLIWLRAREPEGLYPLQFYYSQNPEEKELADVIIHVRQLYHGEEIYAKAYHSKDFEC